MNNKGQSVLSEYVLAFFVVVAAVTAMTTYVQRGFEARINDAKTSMINAVNAACDSNCQAATNSVGLEYEPYYAQMAADVQQNEAVTSGIMPGNPNVIRDIYMKAQNSATQTIANSGQLPPVCSGFANGNCQLTPTSSAN